MDTAAAPCHPVTPGWEQLAGAVAELFAPTSVRVQVTALARSRPDLLPPALRLPGPHTPRRAAEFAAGRSAAYRAIEQLTGRGSWIPRGTRGAPCWPVGMYGSISHSSVAAICAVSAERPIGVDLECMSSAGYLHRGRHLFANADEQRLIDAAPDPSVAALQLFCAKEAAFKALPAAVRAGSSVYQLRISESAERFGAVRRPEGSVRIRSAMWTGHLVTAATWFAGP